MNWHGISITSAFPITRRPIYIHPIAAMSRKNKDEAYPVVAFGIERIIARHDSNKVLVHTVSYDLNSYIQSMLINRGIRNIFTYSSSAEKQSAVDRFLYQPSGTTTVLLAPSLDRGIDLPQDQCRAIVVCKLPFPSLGTKQVSARLHSKGGQLWYNVKTIRSLVQMTGRGMRSVDDYCESYILDKQFITLVWRRNKHLLPKWWKDALVWNAGQL